MMVRRRPQSKTPHSEIHNLLNSQAKTSSKVGPLVHSAGKGLSSDADDHCRLKQPTFRENLPGLQIDAVTDLNAPGRLALCVYESESTEFRSCVEHRGITYVPAPIFPGLAQWVRFPNANSDSGSTENLDSEMKRFLSKYLDQDARTIDVLIAFVFSSWFIDCFQVAPLLWLLGPDGEVSSVLRLLNIMCYHPVLVSDLDIAALRTLPRGLRATLLIKEPDLAPGVERALLNSARRHFCFARGAQPVDIFGARALHSQSPSPDIGLSASIDPARHRLPCLTEIDVEEAAHFFQSRLLAYRMRRYADVQKCEIGPDESYLAFEQEMIAWSGALPPGSELKNSIVSAFAERHEESTSARFQDPKCLVAEGALSFCHQDSAKHFYVGELAERVNDLLVGRHVDMKLEDRKIGSVLKNLGIHANRVTKGYRITLTPKIRARIHSVATAYRVLSVQANVVRCADCRKDQ